MWMPRLPWQRAATGRAGVAGGVCPDVLVVLHVYGRDPPSHSVTRWCKGGHSRKLHCAKEENRLGILNLREACPRKVTRIERFFSQVLKD